MLYCREGCLITLRCVDGWTVYDTVYLSDTVALYRLHRTVGGPASNDQFALEARWPSGRSARDISNCGISQNPGLQGHYPVHFDVEGTDFSLCD